MARAPRFPAYPPKPHKTGQARIRVHGQDVYLGPWGSPESRERYARLAAQFAAGTEHRVPGSVEDLAAAWLEEVEVRYAHDRRERGHVAKAVKVLLEACRGAQAGEVDAMAMEAVQARMVAAGWNRRTVARQVMWLRTMFRWAEKRRLVPEGRWNHLRTMEGPRGAVEAVPRAAVAWESVERVLPIVQPQVAAMLQLQWHTGMRPYEVRQLVVADIQVDRIVLARHKTRHRTRRASIVVLGPNATAVLAPWLEAARRRGDDAHVFPGRRGAYTDSSYAQAVRRACIEAGIPVFTPYQLRHAAKARATAAAGLDAARALLRQESLGTTNLYARQQDLELAERAARLIG